MKPASDISLDYLENHAVCMHIKHDENLPSVSQLSAELNSTISMFNNLGIAELAKGRAMLFDQPKSNYEHKVQTWLSSRLALLHSLKAHSQADIKNSIIYCSISHCRSISSATSILVPAHSKVTGIGIDTEEGTREVRLKTLARVQDTKLEQTEIDPLGQWLSKEVIFKSINNNKDLTLKKLPLKIQHDAGVIKQASTIIADNQYSECVVRTLNLGADQTDWRYALAFTVATDTHRDPQSI